jgi:alanine racemase
MKENSQVNQLQIKASALDNNLTYFQRQLKPKCKTLVVVKAFGYGSSALLVAEHLEPKVDYFAVAYAEEGIALRKSGITTPILVLHPQADNLDLIIQHNLEPNLYSKKILHDFLQKEVKNYPIHLKINTGLNRLGFDSQELTDVCSELKKNKAKVFVQSIYSHLAASEDLREKEFTLEQISHFKDIAHFIENQLGYSAIKHMTNTSGILNYPEAHLDMVRLGIGLYGFTADEDARLELKKAWKLTSKISQIRSIPKGSSVGYNRTQFSKKDLRIATIPIGHADGFFRKLGGGKGWVTIHGQKAYLFGTVCMDIILVDVTDIECREGDTVEVYESRTTLNQFAAICETINYEILTAIGQRIPRKLID